MTLGERSSINRAKSSRSGFDTQAATLATMSTKEAQFMNLGHVISEYKTYWLVIGKVLGKGSWEKGQLTKEKLGYVLQGFFKALTATRP